jgi:hypothetical protein
MPPVGNHDPKDPGSDLQPSTAWSTELAPLGLTIPASLLQRADQVIE